MAEKAQNAYQPEKQTIAVAGVGDLGKYICEELLESLDFEPIILTRSSMHAWATQHNITFYQTDYSAPSLVPILDQTGTSTLISFISPEPPASDPRDYVPVHTALLHACQQSRTCKRLIPAEWAGNADALQMKDRWWGQTRQQFRDVLKEQRDVQWTGVAIGWLADYFLPRPPFVAAAAAKDKDKDEDKDAEERWRSVTYMHPAGEMWPVDVLNWQARVYGTGDEKVSWIFARDVGRAVVRLCRASSWFSTTYLASEWSTFNESIRLLETFYKRPMPRDQQSAMSLEAIQQVITDRSNDGGDDGGWRSPEAYVATVEEMSLLGQLEIPEGEVAIQRREACFRGMELVGLERGLRAVRDGKGTL